MSKLLSAGFRRLWKDKFFWIGTIFMILAGIYMPVMHYVQMKAEGFIDIIDTSFFAYILFITIISSVFCSLFIGTEYSDGTMRNKVVVGHTRTAIYFSNLIVCIIAGIMMCFAFIITYLCAGIPLLGFFQTDIVVVIGQAITSLILFIALTAIYTLVSMLNTSKATSAVICILGIFFLLFVGVYIENRLSEPETYEKYTNTDAGSVFVGIAQNSRYLRGTERQVYEFLYDFTPGGQVIQFAKVPDPHLWQMSFFSTVITIITTGLGIFLFQKKDLN